MNKSVDGPDRLIHTIRSELRARRMSKAALSERLGQNHDYVSMRLRRDVPMTVEFLERICEQLQLSIWELWDRARPREMSKDLGPKEFLKLSIAGDANWSSDYAYLAISPRFGAPSQGRRAFPEARIRHMEDKLWSSRQKAIEAAAFWLSDVKESRSHSDREPIFYAAGLACLAGLIRSIHVEDARLLLLEAFRLTKLAKSRKLNAYLIEKTARLAWDLGHQEMALGWLETPQLLAHPLKDSYFSIRGAYYFYRRRFDEALECFDLVDQMTKSDLCRGCAIDFQALIVAERDGLEAALKILKTSQKLDLPLPAQNTLAWTKARILQLHGRTEAALKAYERLLPQEDDPQRKGYMLIDYLTSGPSNGQVTAIDHMIGSTLDRLDPQASQTDRSVFQQLSALRREYSSADPAGYLRRQLRPGG